MANQEHLEILKQGVEAVNKWQQEHPYLELDLSEINLMEVELYGVDLTGADLTYSNLVGADLRGANLSGALLNGADLSYAILEGGIFSKAHLYDTNLSAAHLRGSNFKNAITGDTIFTKLDLREVLGLEEIEHTGPSEVGINTVYRSEGKIPEEFLRGCGVPNDFIIQIPALVAAMQPIQFYSCFISYSSKDEEFARRLHERMRAAGLRVWFAPEDIKGGQKLHEQIDRAIQVHDRLLLVLSQESMRSEWVMTEIRKARKAEVKEGRRKLFPIRLVDYDALREWECFDADHGKDLAVEVREYFIPDFSNWKSHDEFEGAFARLLSDLKAGV